MFCASHTKPLWALEMICNIAEPTTTKMKSARTKGPTVNWLLPFFLEPLFVLPTFFSYAAPLRDVLRDSGILSAAPMDAVIETGCWSAVWAGRCYDTELR